MPEDLLTADERGTMLPVGYDGWIEVPLVEEVFVDLGIIEQDLGNPTIQREWIESALQSRNLKESGF
jgi:hypothetical protein